MTQPHQTGRSRRVVSIVGLVIFALVPALALGGLWRYADASIPPPTTTTTTTLPPEPDDELLTDLFSYRRQPTPMAEKIAAEQSEDVFEQQVLTLTDDIGQGSCLSMSTNETTLASIDPALSVIPASNQKLLVAAVALDVLGPDYTFKTELKGLTPANGVINGHVYLIGGGDPVLRTADVADPLRYPSFNTTALEPLADALATLGVTQVGGAVVGDGSRYDDEFRAPTWGADITSVDAGPYDALLVNDGLINNGNYGLDPSRSAARVFHDLIVARGVTVAGGSANAATPDDANLTTLAIIESLQLTDILVELLHTSDNNTAEMLVKEIGFVATGVGTRQAGLDTIRATLDVWGVPTEGLLLHDGSGLSRQNRISCIALSTVIEGTPVSGMLQELLPVAGRDGTLAEQFLGTEAEGELRAKTGTLTDVKALSGLQPSGDRTDVTFSLVLNGEGVNDPTVYDPIWKRLVALIDDYPIVVEPDIERFAPPTTHSDAG